MKALLLLIFFICAGCAQQRKYNNSLVDIPAGSESFECGNYIITGKVLDNRNGVTVLELYSSTTRRFSINISGIRVGEALINEGLFVEANVQVTSSGKGSFAKIKTLGSLKTITQTESLATSVKLIEKKLCSEQL